MFGNGFKIKKTHDINIVWKISIPIAVVYVSILLIKSVFYIHGTKKLNNTIYLKYLYI